MRKKVPNTGIEPVAPGSFKPAKTLKTRNVDPYTNSDLGFDWSNFGIFS
jgi:hypothetical protein